MRGILQRGYNDHTHFWGQVEHRRAGLSLTVEGLRAPWWSCGREGRRDETFGGGTTALHVHVHTHYQPWQLRTFLKKMTFLVILRDTNTAHYIHKYDSARKHLTLSPLHTHLSLVCGMAWVRTMSSTARPTTASEKETDAHWRRGVWIRWMLRERLRAEADWFWGFPPECCSVTIVSNSSCVGRQIKHDYWPHYRLEGYN